jgi:hypothetical protein
MSAPQVIWILIPIAGLLFLVFFGSFVTGAFAEMASFVILAGILAIILASRDLLIIAIAILLIARKALTKRPTMHEYDVDSAAWGLR